MAREISHAPDLAADRSRALALTPVSRETADRLDRFVPLLLAWQGTTQLIANAGRMKMSRTRPTAKNMAFGNSLRGSRSDETCTAFISMPE